MPITQNRVIAILAAARSYQQAVHKALSIIDNCRQSVHHNQMTKEEAYDQIEILLSMPEQIVDDFGNVQTVLAIEQYHFQKFARRNERLRLHQESKRRAAGIERQSHTQHMFGIPPVHSEDLYPQRGRKFITRDQIRIATLKRDMALEAEATINQQPAPITSTSNQPSLSSMDSLKKAAAKSGVSIPDEVLQSFTDDADDKLF